MDQLETLRAAIGELRREVAALSESEMETATNCEPWTVRQLASHALNNQLFWAGAVTGQEIVSIEVTMGAVPHDGDLGAFADEVADQSLALWQTDGVLEASHPTPFGELPGSVVVNFPTIDALCHAWDLSASVGRPLEFPAELIPAAGAVVEATVSPAVVEMGLIKAATPAPPDATETERLMALTGRSVSR